MWGGGGKTPAFAADNSHVVESTIIDEIDSEDNTKDSQWPSSMVSGTLPVLFINTEEHAPIVDKVTPIPAGLWIEIPENCSDAGFALGSSDAPVSLTIRGRGNSSWLADKKPYKIKFDKKTEILGMPKHKHFALLPAQVSPVLGMEIARQLELGWAPRNEQVEVILNDEYIGLYSLFESVKIDSNRLDIFGQDDLCEDDEIIPFGWLVEIDNYTDECQIVYDIPDRTLMRVTYHQPEDLSEKQKQWLIDNIWEINDIIYSVNFDEKNRWADYIDARSMAKYFVVREIMEDVDGFNGSMYMYRDNEGDNTRWKMGPLWDPTFNAWNAPEDWTMNRLPSFSTWKILPQIFNTPIFSKTFQEVWDEFYPSKMEFIKDCLLAFGKKCAEADIADTKRWPNKKAFISEGSEKFLYNCLERKAKWIDQNKKIPVDDSVAGIDNVLHEDDIISVEFYSILGYKVINPDSGVYIRLTTFADGSVASEKIIVK